MPLVNAYADLGPEAIRFRIPRGRNAACDLQRGPRPEALPASSYNERWPDSGTTATRKNVAFRCS